MFIMLIYGIVVRIKGGVFHKTLIDVVEILLYALINGILINGLHFLLDM